MGLLQRTPREERAEEGLRACHSIPRHPIIGRVGRMNACARLTNYTDHVGLVAFTAVFVHETSACFTAAKCSASASAVARYLRTKRELASNVGLEQFDLVETAMAATAAIVSPEPAHQTV